MVIVLADHEGKTPEGNPITDEDINNKMFVVVRNTKSA